MNYPTIQEVVNYLVRYAQNNQPITYSEVSHHFGLPNDCYWSENPLCRIFDVIDKEDAAAGRPFLTSVVFNRVLNMPGAGYFAALRKIAGRIVPASSVKRQAIWVNELAALNKYWTSCSLSELMGLEDAA